MHGNVFWLNAGISGSGIWRVCCFVYANLRFLLETSFPRNVFHALSRFVRTKRLLVTCFFCVFKVDPCPLSRVTFEIAIAKLRVESGCLLCHQAASARLELSQAACMCHQAFAPRMGPE